MTRLTIEFGNELFSFNSYQNWINSAQEKFAATRPQSTTAICVDSKGRICSIGKDFHTAMVDEAYPVRVFAKRADA